MSTSKLAPEIRPPAPPVAPMAFPVNLPGAAPPPIKSQRSLFKDMFGTDHSMLAMALDSSWSDPQQRELALQLLSGYKSLEKLTDGEHELLDSMVHSFNNTGGGNIAHDRAQVQAASERLSIPGSDWGRERDHERGSEVQSESDDGMQDNSDDDENPAAVDAYSWTR